MYQDTSPDHTSKILIVLALVMLAVIAGVFFWRSGSSPAEVPAPVKGQVFGSWVVECEPQAEGKEVCFLSQEQRTQDGSGRLLKFSVGKIGAKGEMVGVALLPLGIALQAGAALKIDSQDQKPMALQQCVPDGCIAILPLDQPTVSALRSAKDIMFGVLPFGGTKTAVIAASVGGLSEGMAAMKY